MSRQEGAQFWCSIAIAVQGGATDAGTSMLRAAARVPPPSSRCASCTLPAVEWNKAGHMAVYDHLAMATSTNYSGSASQAPDPVATARPVVGSGVPLLTRGSCYQLGRHSAEPGTASRAVDEIIRAMMLLQGGGVIVISTIVAQQHWDFLLSGTSWTSGSVFSGSGPAFSGSGSAASCLGTTLTFKVPMPGLPSESSSWSSP